MNFQTQKFHFLFFFSKPSCVVDLNASHVDCMHTSRLPPSLSLSAVDPFVCCCWSTLSVSLCAVSPSAAALGPNSSRIRQTSRPDEETQPQPQFHSITTHTNTHAHTTSRFARAAVCRSLPTRQTGRGRWESDRPQRVSDRRSDQPAASASQSDCQPLALRVRIPVDGRRRVACTRRRRTADGEREERAPPGACDEDVRQRGRECHWTRP